MDIRLNHTDILRMVRIEAGSFVMGSEPSETGHEPEEAPARQVHLTHPFLITQTVVTESQWNTVMGAGSHETGATAYPVTKASWLDIEAFLTRLGDMLGRKARLPTEAEWEYACRAGSTTRFHAGVDESALSQGAWYIGNSGEAVHSVGRLAPNAWGLHDMHGNVFEWCTDWYGAYDMGDLVNPRGPESGSMRVLRGGCFKCPPRYCRSANRYSAPPDHQNDNIGFRLVIECDELN